MYRLLLILFSCWLAIPAAAQPLASLAGVVSDATTQLPLEGVVIEIHETNQYLTTDALGHFHFTSVRPGTYHLHLILLGYQPQEMTLTIPAEGITDLALSMQRSTIELKAIEVEEDLLRSGINDRPLSIMVADREQLANQTADNLAGTLSQLPGITSINTGTGIGKPVIRGLSFNRVVVTQDGIKQEGQQWGSDHGLEVDQYAVDRVEVIKGPASLLYGSDAMAGVINLIDRGKPADAGISADVHTFYRSLNDLQGVSGEITATGNKVYVSSRYTHQDFGDYRVPAETFTYNAYVLPIVDSRLKNTAGRERNVTTTAGIGGSWGQMAVTVSNFRQQAGLFSGAIGIPRSYQLDDDGDPRNIDIPYQYTNHFRTTFNGKWITGSGWLHLDAGYQHNLRQEWSYPHIHGLGPAPTDGKALELSLHTWSGNLRYYLHPADDLKIVVGISSQVQDNDVGGFEFLVPAYTSKTAGTYLFAEKKTASGTFSGGARYDAGYIDLAGYLQPQYDADTQIVGYTERSAPLQTWFHNVSASAGWAKTWQQTWVTKVNIGKSFRMPNAAELGMNGVHHGTFRHELGDTSLQSEHGLQLDLGLLYTASNLSFEVSPYMNYFIDFIYLRPTGSFSLLPDAGQVYGYTQANAFHTGADWHVDYHPVSSLHLELSGAYTWQLNTETGLPLPFTPPLNLRPSIAYEWDMDKAIWKGLEVRATYDWNAAQNRTDRNEAATPGFALTHLSSAIHLGGNNTTFLLRAGVQNIFNIRYLNHLSRYRILNLPEPGRNITVSLQWQPSWEKR